MKNPSYFIPGVIIRQIAPQGGVSGRGFVILEGKGRSKKSALLAFDCEVVHRDFVVVSIREVAVVSCRPFSI